MAELFPSRFRMTTYYILFMTFTVKFNRSSIISIEYSIQVFYGRHMILQYQSTTSYVLSS
jgi:hypothetical protein